MQIELSEAGGQLAHLVAAAEQGEEVLLARGQRPVARIVPVPVARVKPPGAWQGLVAYSTGWRSAETDAEIARLFDGDADAPAP